MSSQPGPNPLAVALSVLRARRTRAPRPAAERADRLGSSQPPIDHFLLQAVLDELGAGGVAALADQRSRLADYRSSLESLDPDTLERDAALAYWINLYNAGALDLAAETWNHQAASVLRVAGGFRRPWANVAGEELSLDEIEHGKIRRFRDPRIHGALVCGSASCPTLRFEPFDGPSVHEQLDDQMRRFLGAGGVARDPASDRLYLSRIFLWYGGDFTRPHRMPTLLPVRRKAVAAALSPWLPAELESWRTARDPVVSYQPYDWSLACTIG